MASAVSKEYVPTDGFNWPAELDTEERDQKLIAMLEKEAEDNNDAKAQRALRSAKYLHGLIPRAKAQKWYILLFRDYFVYLVWDEQGSLGSVQPYAGANVMQTIENLESMITVAEQNGMPKEISASTLRFFFTQAQEWICEWLREGKEIFDK